MKKKTKYVILGLLRDENLTGYEIKKVIDSRMPFFWQESFGQIYPELNALAADGFISEAPGQPPQEKEGRVRIKYRITEKGLAEFNHWMEESNEKDTVRSEALLKFFLASSNNTGAIKRHLRDFRENSEELLNLYLCFEDQLKEYRDMHDNHKYLLEVLSLGIMQQKLYFSWSSNYLCKLEKEEAE